MANILAIISKKIFEAQAPRAAPGTVVPLDAYHSSHKALAALADGGSLYLVTVRPGDKLWLVAKLGQPEHREGAWRAVPNSVPLTDISTLRGQIRFESGKGISQKSARCDRCAGWWSRRPAIARPPRG